jgi:CubicO group peptidase (beta-lactamase class C family)
MPPFVAYHGVSAAEHQARVDALAPQGYRPISLSASGDPSNVRYAAVWEQSGGPAWVAVHGITANEYQSRFDALVADGYAPSLVTATGNAGVAVFAAVFEQGVTQPWYARHGLHWDTSNGPNSINAENQRAFDQGYLPRCLAVYGAPGDERFAGVWIKNDQPVPWAWWWTDPSAYQHFFDAEVAAGVRPAYLSVAPSHWMLSVFRDEPIGEWWARHGMTATDYQGEFDARVAAGLEPRVVQAGGTGANARYASIFVRTSTPIARQWHVTGSPFDGSNELDQIVRWFMTTHAIRAMSVAVARAGSLVANRGYTWAEPSYPITQPGALFRVASVSKLFTCAAIDSLVQAGALTLQTPAFAFLGITSKLLPSQTPDPDVGTITVLHLAKRMSGLAHDFGVDLRTIAARLSKTTTPTRDDLVRYVYAEPLVARPGTGDNYSNSAFTVLTSIVEAASHLPFRDYVVRTVLGPFGVNDLLVGATAAGARLAGEVPTYDHPGVSPSQIDMSAAAIAPNTYGGQVVTENSEGVGGLITSTGTVARVLSRHAVWNIGGRELGTRYGEMDGTGAAAVSRGDGLDFSYAMNRRVTTPEHDDLKGQIERFLDVHGARL